jgi:hypothetical protein
VSQPSEGERDNDEHSEAQGQVLGTELHASFASIVQNRGYNTTSKISSKEVLRFCIL